MYFGAGSGWTLYPPLSSGGFSPSGVDYIIIGLHLAGLSRLAGSIKFIGTVYYSVKSEFFKRFHILV